MKKIVFDFSVLLKLTNWFDIVALKVGDNVGDCAARGADLFESIAAEIISAMILGGTMAQRCKIEGKWSSFTNRMWLFSKVIVLLKHA